MQGLVTDFSNQYFDSSAQVGGSLTSVLVDLADIWGRVVETELGIQPGDRRHYRYQAWVRDSY